MREAQVASDGGRACKRITLQGAVQGVGFRPHVFTVASRHGVDGWVRNTDRGVEIIAAAAQQNLDAFLAEVQDTAPPASRIMDVQMEDCQDAVSAGFVIMESEPGRAPQAVISPDLAICSQCLAECFDPNQRRYRYPFINCTHCGPRYSIQLGIPYDRPQTTMSRFRMCAACEDEYRDPMNRRFHAQPNACPDCGPQLALWDAEGNTIAARDAALVAAIEAVRTGRIVALKGLGGFHLIVDACNQEAVLRLRDRKQRPAKPFALMFPALNVLREYAVVSDLETELLTSPAAPIVLLRQRDSSPLAPGIAPGVPLIGAMLPYTPLHALLLDALQHPVVATSGNRSDEPICFKEHEALERLRGIADFYLVHDRPIARPVDDSIVRVICHHPVVLRRARGYAPYPVPFNSAPMLAVGGHLKDTVALAIGRHAVLSQHLGDLDNEPSMQAFEEAIHVLQTIYDVEPATVVCDQHPDYASTRFAESCGKPVVKVQHHHAHVASCMQEHGLSGTVCGLAWDGTGYGTDGTIWGGECLRATVERFERVGHLRTFALPGGDQAAREPRRCAVGLLHEIYGEEAFSRIPAFEPSEQEVLQVMLVQQIQIIRTSSMGRFFDAIASILGLCQIATYEGQAAMLVEFAADGCSAVDDRGYALPDGDWEPLILAVLDDLRAGVLQSIISYSVHASLARCAVEWAHRAELPDVVLTGGCFQNALLTELTHAELLRSRFRVFSQQSIPPNDGGLSLGQLAVANAKDND